VAHVLLTGAGFSRNWGGWLATEAFEYLIGCPEVDDHLRHLLWKQKRQGGGFEDTLAELQLEVARSANENTKKQLADLQAAIIGMFNAMDQAFAKVKFEQNNDIAYLVRTFLARFDAIFTLNQDLLLERHYLDENISLAQSRKWSGWQLPGTKPFGPSPHVYDPSVVRTAMRVPEDPGNFKEQGRLQPYYKLHGSTNWTGGGGSGGRLIIMGGNKAVEISQYPLLDWYHRQFREYLSRAARLMIIGYSFSDAHINRAIIDAAKQRALKIFIVDPAGVDVLNKQDPRHMQVPSELMEALQPRIVGASRRSFLSAFSTDRVEFERLSRFFEN
jgi:SIR2-like domain